jgi:glycosyltransferase involved in cell wall biosynthesis
MVLSASDRGEAYRELRAGVELVRLASRPTPSRRGQRWSWWSRDEIERFLTEFRPELLHLHDPVLGGLVMPSFARERRLPLVVTAHALPWYVSAQAPDLPGLRSLVEAAMWAFASDLISNSQAVVAPSRFTAAQVDAHGGSGTVVISNGVDLDKFRPEAATPDERQTVLERFGLDPARPVILHVGRVDREKNVDDVVRAAAIAMASTDAQLLVVGDGNRLRDVEELARELGIGRASRFIGFVDPNGGMPSIYRTGAVFAIASELESEGIVVLEAAACGVPIVAVRATSMPELVEESGCGHLVPPGDVHAMADRIVQVLRDPAAQRALGEAGVAMARAHSLALTLDRHEELYQSLLVPAAA